ncbi:MAG: HAD-IA family hydrolase [Candidatus Izimaplasma sp.]|nr:HAD-IA family hydrolase [Candidatus Izimaplasma bacterium]
MSKVNTIIYDLDGTLVDSNDVIYKSFRHTFETHFPSIEVSDEDIYSFIGPTLYQTFSYYTTSDSKIDDMVGTYRHYYIENEVGNTTLYPNVIKVLSKLKAKGYNLAVLTSKFREAAWPSYTTHGLDQLFDSFSGLDDVPEPKPSKKSVEAVLANFDSVTGAIMIGDNQSDILAAKNAGIYSAGVAWSLKGKKHLKEVNPDFLLEEMSDIFNILEKLNKE